MKTPIEKLPVIRLTVEQASRLRSGPEKEYPNHLFVFGPYVSKSDDELRATIACMRRHDDEHTSDYADECVGVVVIPPHCGIFSSDDLIPPAPQCIANQMRRMQTMSKETHAQTAAMSQMIFEIDGEVLTWIKSDGKRIKQSTSTNTFLLEPGFVEITEDLAASLVPIKT